MNSNFGKKVEKLAEIIENRIADGAVPGDSPTKFVFVVTEEGLKCYWSKCLPSRYLSNIVLEKHITDNGLTAKEWQETTKLLEKHL